MILEYLNDFRSLKVSFKHSISICNNDSEKIVKKIEQKQKILCKQEVAQIIDGYKSGLTVYQLADKFECNRRTVSNYLKANRTEMRLRPIPEMLIDKAVGLYATGLSCATIGAVLGISAKSVYNKLLQRKVLMRDTHGK